MQTGYAVLHEAGVQFAWRKINFLEVRVVVKLPDEPSAHDAEGIWVRTATDEDLPVVASLIARLLTELSEGDVTDESTVLAAATEALAKPGYVVLLGGCDSTNHPKALLSLEPGYAIYAGGPIGTIRELYVDPPDRCKGVGAALVAVAALHAEDSKWVRLEVTVPAGPRWSRTSEFYRRCGFTDAGPKLRRVL